MNTSIRWVRLSHSMLMEMKNKSMTLVDNVKFKYKTEQINNATNSSRCYSNRIAWIASRCSSRSLYLKYLCSSSKPRLTISIPCHHNKASIIISIYSNSNNRTKVTIRCFYEVACWTIKKKWLCPWSSKVSKTMASLMTMTLLQSISLNNRRVAH